MKLASDSRGFRPINNSLLFYMCTTVHGDEFLKVESDVDETLVRINAAFQILKRTTRKVTIIILFIFYILFIYKLLFIYSKLAAIYI